jgi:hypothetical protein
MGPPRGILSRAIIPSKADCYLLLPGVTIDMRWDKWILYMLDAVAQAATLDYQQDQGDSATSCRRHAVNARANM